MSRPTQSSLMGSGIILQWILWYWHYSESHYMGNEKTKEMSRELNDRLEELSFRENNQVFSLVGSLCAEHERIAFFAGLQLGAQLMLELMEENVQD